MKKIILTSLIALSTILNVYSLDKKSLEGTWGDNNVNLTFNKDTLYIDEINIEGFCYQYTEHNDTITCSGVFDTFDMVIVALDKASITYYYTDYPNEIYTMGRKEE